MATIYELMKKSGMNNNQISKISGISNTYLSKIANFEMDGNRIKTKRKTLINIAVSLNLSIQEISGLLKAYGHGELSTSDIPYFLSASENQTVTGILPIFSSLVKGWFLIGMEKKLSVTEGASIEYVLDQPSHNLKSPDHASFTDQMDFSGETFHPLSKALVESAVIHRRRLIDEALDKGNCISVYICSNCFEKYTLGWKRLEGSSMENIYKAYLREHLETLIEYIETYPDQYQLKLLKKCPRTRYELLYMPGKNIDGHAGKKINMVIFLGRESPCNMERKKALMQDELIYSQGFGDLSGFATDLQNLLEFFHKQHIGLKKHFCDTRYNSPRELSDYIRKLIHKNIPMNEQISSKERMPTM